MLRKLRLFVGAAVASLGLMAACGGGEDASSPGPVRQRLSAPSQMTANGLNALFTWATVTYPQYFSGATQDGTINVDGYGTFSYRHFASGNYLAVLGDAVYVYGPVSGNTISRVGALNNFTCNVYPGNVGCASLSVGQQLTGDLLSADDQRSFTTHLFAGVPYVFTAMSPTFDTRLSLYSAGGWFITASHDPGTGLNSAIWYTPFSSGLHTLQISSASGSGLYVLQAYHQPGVGDSRPNITWPDSVGGKMIFDSTSGEVFSFDAASRCLYSWNRNEILTNFCLDPGSSSGTFAGQPVTVILAGGGDGCSAVLADPSGLQIDIDLSGMVPTATTTGATWFRTGCFF